MKYILVASDGIEMCTSVHQTESEAQIAMRNAVGEWVDINESDNLESSWVGDSSAYLCPLDTEIEEDWCWDIIMVDETSDAIKYLLDELARNKTLTSKENEHETILVAKARIVTILNVLERLGHDISAEIEEVSGDYGI